MLNFILGVIIGFSVTLWVCSNAYMIDSIREDRKTFTEEVEESQDHWLGRTMMTLYYLPTKIYLKDHENWLKGWK